MTIPSPHWAGNTITHDFEITDGERTELLIDIDAERSVVRDIPEEEYVLSPVVRVFEPSEVAEIGGMVVTHGDETALSGVLVTAQTVNPSAVKESDRVVVQSATITDANGEFVLYAPPGAYRLVGYGDGYRPGCISATTNGNALYAQDLVLNSSAMGTAAADIRGVVEGRKLALSYRNDGVCNDGAPGEIAYQRHMGDGELSTRLPVGSYRAIASDNVGISGIDVVVTADQESRYLIDW